MAALFLDGEDPTIWPNASGDVRPESLAPIYRSAPIAARRDPALYELLVIADALRAGRAREKQVAAKELKKRLRRYGRGQNPNLEIMEIAAHALGPLCEELGFLGGCAAALLITDPAAPPVRATRDVDALAEIGPAADYRD